VVVYGGTSGDRFWAKWNVVNGERMEKRRGAWKNDLAMTGLLPGAHAATRKSFRHGHISARITGVNQHQAIGMAPA